MSCKTPKDGPFTRQDCHSLVGSLAHTLIPVVDQMRDLRVQFGFRPYVVRLIHTRWLGARRGQGSEQVMVSFDLLPVPKISSLTSLTEVLQPGGLDEEGGIEVSEISGRYTEEQLRGWFDGPSVDPNEQVYYEVEFLGQCERSDIRRFHLRSVPNYEPERFAWSLRLERARVDRDHMGEPS